jgi:hypothetical protein
MKKLLLLLSTLVMLCTPSFAGAPTGFVRVQGQHVRDSTCTLLDRGTISFAPVNNSGSPISFRANDSGQVITTPVTAVVTSGVFTIDLADMSLTSPVNVCSAVTITSNTTGKKILGPGYSCVQPSLTGPAVTRGDAWCTAASSTGAAGCNFDLYKLLHK